MINNRSIATIKASFIVSLERLLLIAYCITNPAVIKYSSNALRTNYALRTFSVLWTIQCSSNHPMFSERPRSFEHSVLYEHSMLSKPFFEIAFGYSLEPTRSVYLIELVFDNLLAMLANYCICQRHMRQKLLLCIQPSGWIQRASAFEKAVIIANSRSK